MSIGQQLPKCAKCRKTIQLYRIVCILGEGRLACAACANRLDLWDCPVESKPIRTG